MLMYIINRLIDHNDNEEKMLMVRVKNDLLPAMELAGY